MAMLNNQMVIHNKLVNSHGSLSLLLLLFLLFLLLLYIIIKIKWLNHQNCVQEKINREQLYSIEAMDI